MKEIMDLAVKYGLKVVEDNAQAIGSVISIPDGKTVKTGTVGTIGTTSFFPSKNLGAFGDGGALFTRDAALAEVFKMIANHGMKKRYIMKLSDVIAARHHASRNSECQTTPVGSVYQSAKVCGRFL